MVLVAPAQALAQGGARALELRAQGLWTPGQAAQQAAGGASAAEPAGGPARKAPKRPMASQMRPMQVQPRQLTWQAAMAGQKVKKMAAQRSGEH